jgi:hypothetical protein
VTPPRSDAATDVVAAGRDAAGDGSAGGTGGAGGADSAVGGGGGTAGAVDCLDLSRAPVGRYDFRVVGSGFDAYDGETVRAVVVYGNHKGHGLSQTTVRNGSFEIELPKTNEPYTGYGVYIDRGADNACTVNVDPFFQMTSGGVYQDVNWEINPQTRYLEGLAPCNIDGIFDLTQPLSCSDSAGAAMDGGAGSGGEADGGDAPEAVDATDGATDADASHDAATDGPDALRVLNPVHVVSPGDGGRHGSDIRFVGSGLDAFEGRAVLVRVDYPDAVHTHGWGEARIIGGAFDLLLPGALVLNYNPKVALIDVNDDGRCEVGEPAFATATPFNGDTTVVVTPAELKPSAGCDYVNSFPRL